MGNDSFVNNNETFVRRTVVFTDESEDERKQDEVECFHFDDVIRKNSCFKCNSLRRGKTRCAQINPRFAKNLEKFQEFCITELVRRRQSRRCQYDDCKWFHEYPNHIEKPYPFCLYFLEENCKKPNCRKQHLNVQEANTFLKKKTYVLIEDCKICFQKLKEEYEELKKIKEEKEKPRGIKKKKVQLCPHFLKGKCAFNKN